MASRHEKLVAKVGEKNAEHLEPDERVEQAFGGQTGRVHSSAPLALFDLVRRLSGQLQSRLVILTDRNLYVAYPGFFGQFTVHEVKAKYPRAEAGKHVRALANGALAEIGGEQIHVSLATMKFVRQLVGAAGGAGGEAAD
ncbi:MAG: hypothetical protein QOJ55_1556 [Solirubrobacteraceae bacterium]|nr:hypothetical protein [Solirubrobacteraceae bacterium]